MRQVRSPRKKLAQQYTPIFNPTRRLLSRRGAPQYSELTIDPKATYSPTFTHHIWFSLRRHKSPRTLHKNMHSPMFAQQYLLLIACYAPPQHDKYERTRRGVGEARRGLGTWMGKSNSRVGESRPSPWSCAGRTGG